MATSLTGAGAAATTATHAILTSMFSTKTVTAAVGAALLAGTITYLVQQRQIEGLKIDNQDLIAQRQHAAADQQTASQAAQALKEDLARRQEEDAELLRLRNEVGQLRRERAAAQLRANQAATPAANSRPSYASPGRYISRDQLAFKGYATPEAAVESQVWALINGNFDQYVASHIPEPQENELNAPQAREQFENDREEKGALLKAMQVVGQRTLAEDKLDLKVKWDLDFTPAGGPGLASIFVIQQAVKVGNDWKLGSNRLYDADKWDQDEQAQPSAQ